MATYLTRILSLLPELTDTDLGLLNLIIKGRLDPKGERGKQTFLNRCVEERFSDGLVCPRCGGKHIHKHSCYGKEHNKQRYRCADCGKTFSLTTKTVFYQSKLPIETWLAYADCMIDGKSLRECAKEVDVCLKTAFYMRHKILSALRENIGVDHLSGIIEMDETFVAESFKGNHNRQYKKDDANSRWWVAPRNSGKSRQRGKQVDYRGLSHEQVCISTALDRNGGMALVAACYGKVNNKRLTQIYEGKVEQGATICTDSNNAYRKFATNVGADLVQIGRGMHRNGIYHINHVNSLHSKFKLWVKQFYGMASKYMQNYLYWFNWLERNGAEQSGQGMVLDVIGTPLTETHKDIRQTVAFG